MPAIPSSVNSGDIDLAELDAHIKAMSCRDILANEPDASGLLHKLMARIMSMAKWPFERIHTITCRLCECDISSDVFEKHSKKCSIIQGALSEKHKAEFFLEKIYKLCENDYELYKLCQEALLVKDNIQQGIASLAGIQHKLIEMQQKNSLNNQLNMQRLLYLVQIKQAALERLQKIGYTIKSTDTGERKNLIDLLSATIKATSKQNHNSPLVVATTPSINDFDVLKYLSRGAFGSVYLARHKKTGDLFAIKAIDKDETRRKNTITHALTERRALALINSPWIVSLYYAFEAECTLFLVMEFMIGGNLGTLLKAMKVLDRATIRFYAAELIVAVDTLHSVGIIHHDLKPENIVIDEEGHIRLIDLGLARTDGMVRAENLGTPDYMAPELIIHKGYYSSAVDVWSIGCILFEMLNGRPPFHADSVKSIFEKIMEGYAPKKTDFDELNCLINKALSSDPSKRPTCSQLKDDPFFKGINWANLRESMKPPFIPNPKTADDTSYFEPCSQNGMSIFDRLDEAKTIKLNERETNSPSKGASVNILSEASSHLSSSLFDSCSSNGSSPFAFKNVNLLESLNRKQLRQKASEHSSPLRKKH